MRNQLKHILIIILIAISTGPAGENYIKIATSQVGPGVVHEQYLVPTVPWSLDVLAVALADSFIGIETVKAHDQLYGRERPTDMAARTSYSGHRVVGAVNGDFFATGGIPCNMQVVNGEFVRTETNNTWSVIGFAPDLIPQIAIPRFKGKLLARDGFNRFLSGINIERRSNYLVLYNHFHGEDTETNQWGAEAQLTPLEPWSANDTITCYVDAIFDGQGSMRINPGKVVLSGHGTAREFMLDYVQAGDTVDLYLGLTEFETEIAELMGGYPRIVKAGENYAVEGYNQEGGPPHTFQRFARTAIGYSAGRDTLYIVTVDGDGERWADCTPSKGMDLIELADFMIYIGVADGINFDGGGSSTMVVWDRVVNAAVSCGVTAVASALEVISAAPQGSLATIQIEPDYYHLFKAEGVQLKTSGWDQYFNPVNIAADQVSYRLSGNFGAIDSNGFLTAQLPGDSGYVYASYQGWQDSAFIYVKTIDRIDITPDSCVTDTLHTVDFTLRIYDEDNMLRDPQDQNVSWHCADPQIGGVDSNGIFQAYQAGTVQVIANYDGFSDTATVFVTQNSGQQLLNSMENISQWTLSGENLNLMVSQINVVSQPASQGSGALCLDYGFVRNASQRNYAYLNTPGLEVDGVPAAISFDFKSDGADHAVYLIFRDFLDRKYSRAVPYLLSDSTQFVTARITIDQPAIVYPIEIKGFKIRLGYCAPVDSINQGSLYFDQLVAHYGDLTGINSSPSPKIAGPIQLEQNYPNPFNASTTIRFHIKKEADLKLVLYDLLGTPVAVLVDQKMPAGKYNVTLNSRQLASGVYFCRLVSGEYRQTRKLLIIK